MLRKLLLLLLVFAVAGITVWGFRVGALQWYRGTKVSSNSSHSLSWTGAVEKVKEDRGPGAYAAVEIPPELRHYSDRHWFLAAQVAEVGKHNIKTCQDFVDLAAMIERGEIVTLPGVTETYVLYGVGQKADDKPFSRYHEPPTEVHDSRNMESEKHRTLVERGIDIELYSEAQVNEAYKRLDEKRSKLQTEIEGLKVQSRALKKGEREKQKELQKQTSELQRELSSTDEDKAEIDKFYGLADGLQNKSAGGLTYSRQELFRDYDLLQRLAKNFVGRSFDLEQSQDRQAMKRAMLSSLRPEALKILEEVASAYHRQFDRPLPISSLVRPEQYQHELRKVNRNAVLIETPPHSTGLAFEIDYRYMSATEQKFVMSELARLKNEGRIEVIRESNANYHVFAFINGTRPCDDLITASLEAAGAPTPEVDGDNEGKGERVKGKGERVKVKGEGSKSVAKSQRRRRR
jgi:hypothetical protein